MTSSHSIARQSRRVLWRDLLAPKEPFNSWSHLAAAAITVVLSPWLLWIAATPSRIAAMSTLLVGMLGTFTCSALTHALHAQQDEARLERWDRTFIYVLIAGTYTPLCLVVLSPGWSLSIIVAIWTQAALGVGLCWSRWALPRWLSTGLYVVMGWTLLLCIGHIWRVLLPYQRALLLLGGLSYTVGALIYVLRRPDPWSQRFGYHGIWHLLVVLGAGSFVALLVSVL